jgi:hypothetical protein
MQSMWNFADSMGRTGLDVLGFHVEATDGVIGTIDEVSALPGCAYIVVDTASWLSGTKRLLPAGVVQSVNENRRAVRVALSKRRSGRHPSSAIRTASRLISSTTSTTDVSAADSALGSLTAGRCRAGRRPQDRAAQLMPRPRRTRPSLRAARVDHFDRRSWLSAARAPRSARWCGRRPDSIEAPQLLGRRGVTGGTVVL